MPTEIEVKVRVEGLEAVGEALEQAGAVRVASNEADGISNVAFKNPDGSLVLIALNGNAAATAFSVKAQGKTFGYTLPAGAVATFVWRP